MQLRRIVITTAASLITMGAMVIPTASPAFAYSCPQSTSKVGTVTGQYVAYYNVTIRTGPSTACPALGQAQLFDDVRLDCTYSGWTHIRDNTNYNVGWVRNDMLRTHPAIPTC